MKQIYKLIFAVLIVNILSGCGSKNIEVNVPESKIMSDKEKSYIVFSRPSAFVGSAVDVDLIEIDIQKKEPIKLVGIISNGEKIIYETKEGTHYFFSNVGQNENIEQIDIKKGEIKYVNLGVNTHLMMGFYPLVLEQKRLDLKEKLQKYTCDKKTLTQFLFQEDTTKEGSSNDFYKSPIQFRIECNKGQIIDIKDLYYEYTIDELTKVKLVQSSEKAISSYNSDVGEFSQNIKEYYPIWDFKFKNVPIIETSIMLLDDVMSDNNLNKFKSINIISGNHNERMDKELISEYINELRDEFKELSKNNKKATLKITFDKYDNGNMAARYMLVGIGKNSYRESMGVIDFKVELIDENNQVFNTFRVFEVEAGGILGGINTLKSDTMKIVVDYVKNNLIEK